MRVTFFPSSLPSPSPIRRVSGVFLSLLLTVACAFGQGYHLVKIVDEDTARPDDLSRFFDFTGSFTSRPTLDNGKLVFRPATSDAIWAANVDGTGLRKLIGVGTPAPGGTGNFQYFTIINDTGTPVVSDGAVVFPATSATSDPNTSNVGLYSVPLAGGAPALIADRNTPQPGASNGNPFHDFGSPAVQTGNFTVSQGKVAFVGGNSEVRGIYLAKTDGSGLTALADGNHPAHPEFTFPVKNFVTPALYHGKTVFYGTTVFDPSNGYSALYTTTGGFMYDEIATSNTPLPGNTDNSPHTRFDQGPVFDGTRLAFVADDANSSESPAYSGLYTQKVGGGGLTTIFNSKTTTLPGTSFAPFFVTGFALKNGTLVFGIGDSNQSYYVYSVPADRSGPIQRIVGTGDHMDNGQGVVAAASVLAGGFDGTNIGLMIYYRDAEPDSHGVAGVYVASPGPVKAPVLNSPTSANATVGDPFYYQILSSNSPTYGVSGLFKGISVNSRSGLIYGTPTGPGTHHLTLKVANGAGSDTQPLTVNVQVIKPDINSPTTATAQVGQFFNYTIKAAHGPTSFGVSGLRPGLSVDKNSGYISGTPTGAGTFTMTLKASNAAGSDTQQLTLTIKPSTPVITSDDTATAKVGQSFSYQIKATSSPTGYDATGLPSGLTVNKRTGLISGKPTAAGTFSVTVDATNTGGTGQKTLTLTVNN